MATSSGVVLTSDSIALAFLEVARLEENQNRWIKDADWIPIIKAAKGPSFHTLEVQKLNSAMSRSKITKLGLDDHKNNPLGLVGRKFQRNTHYFASGKGIPVDSVPGTDEYTKSTVKLKRQSVEATAVVTTARITRRGASAQLLSSAKNLAAELKTPACNKMLIFDRWFDICNSRENFSDKRYAKEYVLVTFENADKYTTELLDMIRWVYNWRDSFEGQEDINQHFLADETVWSIESVCYTFAAVIQHFCKVRQLPILLRNFSQDINENHFSHVRAWGGCTNHINQVGTNHAAMASNFMRLGTNTIPHGNVTSNKRPTRLLVALDEASPSKRLRSASFSPFPADS